jgi:hypothetical protein
MTTRLLILALGIALAIGASLTVATALRSFQEVRLP